MTSDDSSALNQKLATLLPKCSRSDEQAFSDIYKLTSPKIFAVLVRSLGLNESAEQALQETYTQIWSKAGDYRSDQGLPITWMTGIARAHATQVLRERREHDALGDVMLPATAAVTELAEIEFLDKDERSQALETCLNELEEQPRDCIVRAYAEGLSHEELSELHDTPVGSIKSWIHRGLLSLKGCAHGLS